MPAAPLKYRLTGHINHDKASIMRKEPMIRP